MNRLMRDRAFVVLIGSVVLVADQATKWIVSTRIVLHDRLPIVENYLALTHVRNRGAAFGLFTDVPSETLRTTLVIVSVAAVGLIWAYAREGWHQPGIVIAFGAILGGAIGNLVDRMRLGYVVDFIDVHWGPYHWPSFNVADAAITVGALSLFIAMARHGDEDEVTETAHGDVGATDVAANDRPADEQPAEETAGAG